jgi:hypothetical protein
LYVSQREGGWDELYLLPFFQLALPTDGHGESSDVVRTSSSGDLWATDVTPPWGLEELT